MLSHTDHRSLIEAGTDYRPQAVRNDGTSARRRSPPALSPSPSGDTHLDLRHQHHHRPATDQHQPGQRVDLTAVTSPTLAATPSPQQPPHRRRPNVDPTPVDCGDYTSSPARYLKSSAATSDRRQLHLHRPLMHRPGLARAPSAASPQGPRPMAAPLPRHVHPAHPHRADEHQRRLLGIEP